MNRLKHLNPSGRGIGRGSFRGGGLGTAVVLLLAAAVLSSCATTPPDRIVYNTLDDATTGIHTAMKAFNVAYQAGKATEDQRGKVLAAYAKWQDVARLAVHVAPGATAPNPDVIGLALSNAAELVALIRTLTGGK